MLVSCFHLLRIFCFFVCYSGCCFASIYCNSAMSSNTVLYNDDTAVIQYEEKHTHKKQKQKQKTKKGGKKLMIEG